jgi:hypothetical protein
MIMLISIALSIMSLSSITVILYVNYFTARTEKELKQVGIQNKFRKPLQTATAEDGDKQLLVEAV